MSESAPRTEEQWRVWLAGWLSALLERPVGQAEIERPLQEFGVSSRSATMPAARISTVIGEEQPSTLVWTAPSGADLARTLAEGGKRPERRAAGEAAEPDAPIAVVALACRFPGAPSAERFWELLGGGEAAISEVPEGRWAQFAEGADEHGLPRAGGYLGDVSAFDAEFSGISPREAESMDPQQRLLPEVAWEAIGNAGVPAKALRGSDTGVFVGLSATEYAQLTMTDLDRVDAWSSTGAAAALAANRLSHALGVHGPGMTVDTACSSSLVAVHLAMNALRTGEASAALVGGVNLLLSPGIRIAERYSPARTRDGSCCSAPRPAPGHHVPRPPVPARRRRTRVGRVLRRPRHRGRLQWSDRHAGTRCARGHPAQHARAGLSDLGRAPGRPVVAAQAVEGKQPGRQGREAARGPGTRAHRRSPPARWSTSAMSSGGCPGSPARSARWALSDWNRRPRRRRTRACRSTCSRIRSRRGRDSGTACTDPDPACQDFDIWPTPVYGEKCRSPDIRHPYDDDHRGHRAGHAAVSTHSEERVGVSFAPVPPPPGTTMANGLTREATTVTTWSEVINYVNTRYEVMELNDTWVRFRLDTEGDRTQQVAVHHVRDADGGAWLEISSAVGRADSIDHRRLLELAATSLVGGAAVADGVALLKHTVPLEDLSVLEEFERPLTMLVASADAFEHELTRADNF